MWKALTNCQAALMPGLDVLDSSSLDVVGFSWEVNFLKSNCVDKVELRDRVV